MQKQSLFDSEIQQSEALINYILSVIALPETIFDDGSQFIKGYFLFGLPLTIPLSLMTTPIFFLTRNIKIAGQTIMQKISPDPERTDGKKVLRYLSKGAAKQIQVSHQTWREAMKHASQQLILKQNKRIIVINELQRKNVKKQHSDEKEFIFVVDQEVSVSQLCEMVRKRINSETDSMYLMFNKSVLPAYMKAGEITVNKSGIIKLGYASIETFG